MKNLILLSLFTLLNAFTLIAQTQIGDNLYGKSEKDRFGSSVSCSADGNRIAIGAPGFDLSTRGYISVYELVNDVWMKLGNDIKGEVADRRAGKSVSISADGNRVAFGATVYDGAEEKEGQIKIYEYSNGIWTKLGNNIIGESNSDRFGSSLSLSADGTRVAIGAPWDDNYNSGNSAGQVKIFEFNGGDWIQLGKSIQGAAAHDGLGESVSLSSDGMRVAIGVPNFSDPLDKSGEVRIYEFNKGDWKLIGNNIKGEEPNDRIGISVSLSADGMRVAIGAPFRSYFDFDTGYVLIYEYNGSEWEQLGNDMVGEGGVIDEFGSSVSLSADGMRVAVGAPYTRDPWGTRPVRLYEYTGGNWLQLGNDIVGDTIITEWFGTSISLSADGVRLAIGAMGNDFSGDDAGMVQVYSFSDLSVSIENIDLQELDLEVYPNPTSGIITFSGSELNDMEILISDSRGVIIKKTKLYGQKVNLNEFPSGLYWIKIYNEKTFTIRRILKM